MWSKVVCNVEVFDQNFTTFLYLPICFKKPLWWEKSWKDKNTFESCCSGHWICLLLHWDLPILWWVQCNVCHSNLNNSQGGQRCLFCLDLLAATFLPGKAVLETTIIIFYPNVSFPDPLVEWAVLSILFDCRAVLKMAGSPSPFAGQATEQLAAEAIASLLIETKRILLPRWILGLSIHCLVKVMLGWFVVSSFLALCKKIAVEDLSTLLPCPFFSRDLLPGLRELEVKLVESSPNLDLIAPYVHVTWSDIMSLIMS